MGVILTAKTNRIQTMRRKTDWACARCSCASLPPMFSSDDHFTARLLWCNQTSSGMQPACHTLRSLQCSVSGEFPNSGSHSSRNMPKHHYEQQLHLARMCGHASVAYPSLMLRNPLWRTCAFLHGPRSQPLDWDDFNSPPRRPVSPRRASGDSKRVGNNRGVCQSAWS
jgi:hypothetical protein